MTANIHKAVDAEIRRAEVRGVLTYLAHVKQFTDYRTLASCFGMFSGGAEMARVLGEIQVEDDAAGRGLLSSLVVGVNSGVPGRGYFEHARQKLKRSVEDDPEAERAFWSAELAKLDIPTPAVEAGDPSQTPEEQVRAAIARRLPRNSATFEPDDVGRLVEAWNRGATSYSTIHPAIEVVFGDQPPIELVTVLDRGLERACQQGADLRPLLNRFLDPKDFRLARGAANELWAVAHVADAGGRIVLEDERAPGKKPDFGAEFEGEAMTFEVVGVNVAHDAEKRNNDLAHKFRSWPRGKKLPADLLGRARHGDGVRMLEMSVPVLKAGPLVEKIDALAKLKDSTQLQGRPCPVLVISARHQWGFFASDCAPTRVIRSAKYTGIGFAATYGRTGDYVFDGEEFTGRGYELNAQRRNGILRSSETIAAVVFMFQQGKSVVFENLQPGCGFPSSTMARFVRRAFDADPELSVFRAH